MFGLLRYIWNCFEIIANIFYSFANLVKFVFYLHVWFGETIVLTVSKCLDQTCKILSSLFTGVTIMFGDFAYFLSDIENIIASIGSLIEYLWDFVTNTISGFITTILNTISSLIYFLTFVKDSTHDICRNGMKGIYDCLITFKGAIILIGNVIWMSIKLIPAIFIYLISIFVFFINRSAEEIATFMSTIFYGLFSFFIETYLFISDTPLESFCGLLVGFTIIYFSHKHRIILIDVSSIYLYKIFKYLEMIFLMSASVIFNACCSCLIKFRCLFQCLKEKLGLATRNFMAVNQQRYLFDRMCVVCKDNESKVVIMPCKHMCLCENCSNCDTFRNFSLTSCPLCRQPIESIIQVYL